MKYFHCACGQRVFFDNQSCLACGRELGFDFPELRMLALDGSRGGVLVDEDGNHYRECSNFSEWGNCNWLIRQSDSQSLCHSCRLNEVIPDLSRPDNLKLWTRFEQAKRRLLYSLRSQGLPLAWPDGGQALRFRLLEDRRRNPEVLEQFVQISHQAGTITINIAEADDVERHAVREQMQERYRTVLGHLRHESGHFYFNLLVDSEALLAECRQLFGDERADYPAALERHYREGPPAKWPEHFVSAYASSHPYEDFAETFAHYLHIGDALETAYAAGLTKSGTQEAGSEAWIADWVRLAISLNEILRSLGADDPYPFVITSAIERKLRFIGRLVHPPASPTAG